MSETSIRLVDGETRAALPLSSPERALSAANLSEAVDEIKLWATEQGLRGATARDLFEDYCRRLDAHGFELMRAYVSTQTLHPQWTGYGYTWKREWQSVREQQFARGGPISQEWLASPFYALIQRSQAGEKKVWLRRRLELGPGQRDFPALVDFYNAGATDYLCLGFRFGENADPSHGTGVLYSFTTDRPGGFHDAEIELLHSTLPELSLAKGQRVDPERHSARP
jgi:adenylate cyclase